MYQLPQITKPRFSTRPARQTWGSAPSDQIKRVGVTRSPC